MSASSTPVFLWLNGQHDNVGDSVLRRPYARALVKIGSLTVWAGGAASGYLRGLALPERTHVAPTVVTWYLGFVRAVLRGRTVLAFNAGEFVVTRSHLIALAALLPWLPLLHAHGGTVLWVGAGTRPDNPWTIRLVRFFARGCDLVLWRDHGSGAVLMPAPTMPDWAFGLPAGGLLRTVWSAEPRKCIAVSLRGDRPAPSREWISAVARCAERLDAEIVVVTQVAHDVGRSGELADLLGARHVTWAYDDHVEQELVLRAVYRQAFAVISDRLHVLILAATEGAVPLGWCEQATTKIDRHFGVVGAHWVAEGRVDPVKALDELDRQALSSFVERTHRFVTESRSRIDGVVRRIHAVAGRSAPIRVLHSLRPPDGRTRYVDQMIAGAPPDVSVLTFSWPRALFGSYDLFQIHWPEFLVRHRTRLGSLAKRVLTRLLLLRLRLTGTPLIRTAHNLAPHESGGSAERRLLAAVDRRIAYWIALNPATVLPAGADRSVILHGHYRGRFAREECPPTAGRVLQIGLIRPYKGVERLIDVFGGLPRPDLSLRIVGKPIDDDMHRAVEARASGDPRVSLSLAFVPDDELAREVAAAELVVLPYREMHNSGIALVALSLDRPILVPRTPASEALQREVGPGWVQLFDGELTTQVLEAAIDRAAQVVAAGGAPDLRDRDWDTVGERHAEVYRHVLGRAGAAPRTGFLTGQRRSSAPVPARRAGGS